MYFDTKIVSVSSGKVLTVPGPTTLNIPLELDNDTGAPNQVWRWVSVDDTWSKVVSKASGNLLDAPDPVSGDAPIIALEDGSKQAAVIQCDETGSPNQHWAKDLISPCVFKLRVRSSHKYLEAPNYPSGTIPVFQRGASESQDQQWRLVMVDLGEEPFKIISRASGKVLEVPNATTDDVPVGQNADTGNPHQQWRLVPVAGGFFKIVSLSSQKVLDAKGSPRTTLRSSRPPTRGRRASSGGCSTPATATTRSSPRRAGRCWTSRARRPTTSRSASGPTTGARTSSGRSSPSSPRPRRRPARPAAGARTASDLWS